ncbi:hepatic leukemia factor-like [Nymphalis io]|uniref:hepatic leukemia factor-like n=1 Tax=Inachis io TaxID=171585 RepID=UPI00216862B2|nr:hepatic leukemia factor-like [Nymphalis io]
MALWTPYAEEPLDLTTNVKQEVSPDSTPGSKVPDYRYSSEPPSLEHENRSYNCCECNIPPSQISPVESWNYRNAPSTSQSEDLDVDSLSDDAEYQAFEQDAFRAMAEKNGGSLLGNNPRMRRAVQRNRDADDSYRKQREKNNYAAKQSRDRRKLREVRHAFQVTYLKKRIAKLRPKLRERVCQPCQQQGQF